jgi:hypothetical protein
VNQECRNQRCLAAHSVAIVPENHCADWASDKADSIDGKRLQHARGQVDEV